MQINNATHVYILVHASADKSDLIGPSDRASSLNSSGSLLHSSPLHKKSSSLDINTQVSKITET